MGWMDFFRGRGRQILSTRSNGDPPKLGTQEFLELYETHPWIRGMLSKVGDAVGATQWQLWRTDRDEPIPNQHPLYRLLRQPNPMITGRSLWKGLQLSLDLVGGGFFIIQRGSLGVPTQLWPIPAHWVVETPTVAKPTYRLSFGDLQGEIKAKDMLWVNDPSPGNPYMRGTGIVQALGDEAQSDENAAKYLNTLFYNKAAPWAVVMAPEADDKAIKVFERAWLQKLQGMFKAMQPIFSNRELKFWQPQEMNLENLTLVPVRQFERDIQLQVYGMPPEQMGITETSNRATAEVSDYIFHSRLVRPRREFLADALTYFAWEFDERIEVRFVDTTPQDKDYKLNVMKSSVGAFRVDEIRAAAGEPPIGGELGAAFIVPLNSYLTADPLDMTTRPNYKPPEEPNPEKPPEEPNPEDTPPPTGDDEEDEEEDGQA